MPPSPAPLIHLDAVTRRFPGGRVALAGVDLDVHAGDFVALLGASGCGKSTLLRLVCGLDAPSTGRVALAPEATGAIGYVPQDAALMPWASVRRNVALPLTLRGERPAEARVKVDAALRAVGLADAAEAVPRELSGGMRMRASLARALVTAPRLWLLDEPFGALDEITRFALNQTLLALCQPADGTPAATAVFVTHSVYEAVFLCRRVVVMARPGRVAAEIAVDAPYPRPPSWRDEPAFAAACARVSRALQQAGEAEAAR